MCVPEGWKTKREKGYIALDWWNEMQNAYERLPSELLKPHALETRGSATNNTEVWCQFKCTEHQENAPN